MASPTPASPSLRARLRTNPVDSESLARWFMVYEALTNTPSFNEDELKKKFKPDLAGCSCTTSKRWEYSCARS